MECSICLSSIKIKTQSICNNNHHYHPKCINEWLDKERTCPICREVIPEVEQEVSLCLLISDCAICVCYILFGASGS